MCICKRSSSKKRTTTRRTVNKTMPPPPPPPTRRVKGMTPPAAPTHTTTTTSPPAAAVPAGLSTSQLSAILDPFFIDTCDFLREASAVQRQHAAAPAPTSPTADTNAQHQRIEHAFLSGPAVVAEVAEYAQHEAKMATGNGGGGGGALDSFALLSSAAWMGAVQDMEAEKNDMLGLDVRSSSF